MKTQKIMITAALALLLAGTPCAGVLKWRGFRATSTPSAFETVAARSIRDFAIPMANVVRAMSWRRESAIERAVAHLSLLPLEQLNLPSEISQHRHRAAATAASPAALAKRATLVSL
jgi:hypothetical protein